MVVADAELVVAECNELVPMAGRVVNIRPAVNRVTTRSTVRVVLIRALAAACGEVGGAAAPGGVGPRGMPNWKA